MKLATTHMREQAGAPLEFIKRFRDLPPEFTPGEMLHYDNSGYFLLDVTMEQVSSNVPTPFLHGNRILRDAPRGLFLACV